MRPAKDSRREAQRWRLEQDVESFKRRGGKVKEVPSGYQSTDGTMRFIVNPARVESLLAGDE